LSFRRSNDPRKPEQDFYDCLFDRRFMMKGSVTGRRGLFLASLILLAGCAAVLQGPPPESPEHGQVRVTFGTGAERTAAPRLDQFSKIDLTFVRTDGAGTLSPVEVQGGAAVINLTPGTWEITASAYNNAEPPLVAARAVNTLTRSGDTITGNTHFALAPAGIGPGILRYTVAPPQGIILDGARSRIQIEKDGGVFAGLNSGDFNAGIRPINAALTGATLSLEPGRYVVDIVLDDSAGVNTAAYREAAAILPGLVTDIVFVPQTGDFLDPDVRAALTQIQANWKFRKTANDTSQTAIGDTGGGGINWTQALLAPDNTETVYFTLDKSSSQTVEIGGPDAARVSQAPRNNTVDGSTASSTLAVFTVDTRDLAAGGGSREFTLTLRESGKTPVVYAVTLAVGYHLTHLHIDAWPTKRVYVTGESFDPTGLVLQGRYSDGIWKPVTDGWTVEGFDTAVTGEKVVRITKQGIQAKQYWIAANNIIHTEYIERESFTITVAATSVRNLFFDYGIRRSALDTQPDRYSVPLGRILVLAPVKWHIPDNAVYEWKVDNAFQDSTTEYLRFAPSTQKTYTITVKATVSATESYTASTTIECVAPEGTYKRATSGATTAQRVNYFLAPGQFTTSGEASEGFISLGAWGGYAVYQFDHSVEKGAGRELKIVGNGFLNWSEPGVVWVMQDENGDGQPNDTWYELAGSHTLLPQTKRRYAVTYTNKGTNQTVWEDNYGGTGSLSQYPKGAPSPMTFVGTGLAGRYTDVFSGYVDSNADPHYSIRDAIQVDGTPVSLSYIDFVKVQTSLNVWAGIFGEVSTEIYSAPQDTGGPPDPNSIIEGAADSGQYNYRFVNSSGYDLTIAFNGTEFALTRSATVDKTSPNASEYVYYWGGNVDMTRSAGTATFTDRPE
jgi:hypothetical protein